MSHSTITHAWGAVWTLRTMCSAIALRIGESGTRVSPVAAAGGGAAAAGAAGGGGGGAAAAGAGAGGGGGGAAAAGAGADAAGADASSTPRMVQIGSPTGTVAPSAAIRSPITPSTGDGTSAFTLSVITSAIGS